MAIYHLQLVDVKTKEMRDIINGLRNQLTEGNSAYSSLFNEKEELKAENELLRGQMQKIWREKDELKAENEYLQTKGREVSKGRGRGRFAYSRKDNRGEYGCCHFFYRRESFGKNKICARYRAPN